MKTNWNDLIERYLSGIITDAEARSLEVALKADPELRDRYLDALNLDSALEMTAEAAEMVHRLPVSSAVMALAPAKEKRWGAWLSWRPLTAAAAGIVFGMICTSMVSGFAVQQQMRAKTLLTEGFEDVQMQLIRGVPHEMEVWSGDLLAPQTSEAGVMPAEGLRMVQLPPMKGKKLSYAFRFFDVAKLPPISAAETRRIEVTAQFQGAVPSMRNRFQIRLAAFAEDVPEAREIWVKNQLDKQALLHVSKTVKVEAETNGWTTVRSMIDVPAEARVVLIALAAGLTDLEKPESVYYLDGVQVRLITQAIPLS